MANPYIPYNLFISDMVGEDYPTSVRVDWDESTIIKSKPEIIYYTYACDDEFGTYVLAYEQSINRWQHVPTKTIPYWVKVSAYLPSMGESALSDPLRIPPCTEGANPPITGALVLVASEYIANGDNSTINYSTNQAYRAGSLSVYVNGVLQDRAPGIYSDFYTEVNPYAGTFSINVAWGPNDIIRAQYIPDV